VLAEARPARDEREIEVLTRSIVAQFEQYVKLNKKVPPEILTSLAGIDTRPARRHRRRAHVAASSPTSSACSSRTCARASNW
jgi:ATP-dependent Lon protease